MKCWYSFEEGLRQPFDSLVNFEYVMTHPEARYQVWEKFRFDTVFKNKVNERIFADPSFKTRWFKYFGSFYKTLAIPEEALKENKHAIMALVKKY